MYFEFVTPRMLILHPIMSIKVLRNRNLIHDSFDGRVVNVLRAKRFLRNYDYVEPYVERIFDRMLRESLTRRGQFLIDFVKVRFGISKNASIKSSCSMLKEDLKNPAEPSQFRAKVICALFSKFSDIAY